MENSESKNYQEKYKMLLELAVDAFFQGDSAGNFIMVNDKAVELTGFSKSELLQMNVSQLFSRDMLQSAPFRYDKLDQGETVITERSITRKDGTKVFVEMHSRKMPDGTYQSFYRNLTKRAEAALALAESESRYRKLHHSMIDGFVYVDMTGRIIDSNETYRQMLGYTAEELSNLTFEDLTPARWHRIEQDIVKNQVIPEGHSEVYEKEYVRKDRTIFPVELRTFLVCDDKGENEGMWAIVRNITERKKAAEALQRSEIEYRDTLNSLPDWIYVVDHHMTLLVVNASLAEAMSSSGSELNLPGGTIEVDPPFVSEEDVKTIASVFKTGAIVVRRHTISLNGQDKFIETTMVPTRKDGEVIKVISVIRDRSKEKEIEELKQRSSDQKEVLLREIHHRVKNNLSIVISLLTFQLNENQNPVIKRSLIDIQTRIRAMALIHEHLYRSENLDKIPLAGYISSLVQMVMSTFSGHKVMLSTNLEPIESSIETALPVGLIINELLTNAFKYAFPDRPDGTITIELIKSEDDYCIVSVADDGIGLPVNCSPDNTSSLGLYIVKLLTEQMDGTLNILRDNGSKFEIRFRNLFRRSSKF